MNKIIDKIIEQDHGTWFPCTFHEGPVNNKSIQSFTVSYMCSVAVHLNIQYMDIYMFTIRIFICTFDNCEIMKVVNEQNRYLNVWIFKYIVKL